MSGLHGIANRWQQVVPAGLVVMLAVWVTFVSFDVKDPQPYLFPRLIAVAMLALSLMAFGRALGGRNRTGRGLHSRTLRNIWPGLAVMAVYVFLAADWLGFYAAGAAAFMAMYTLYDPSPHNTPGIWIKRVLITIGFMSVMYCIFALILRVQTPRGLLV